MTMTQIHSHEAALASLSALLGPKGYTSEADDLAPWLTDWRGRYSGRAAALLSPASTAEVSEIVRICAAARLPIVPQGGNSSMVGGATPDDSGAAVILSLRRMNHIRDIQPADGLVRCEAGVILQSLHEAVAAHGQRFPLTLGGKGSATIGGLISTNAGGTQVLRHGTMRALVAGLEAVLPDGQILDVMAPLKKDNRGYDLRHLLIGAEGTLGIVTAATLRIVPAILDRCVIWAGVDSPHMAYRLLRFLEGQAADRLEGFELVGDHCLQSVLRHIPATRAPLDSPHPWHILVEMVQSSAAQESSEELATRLFAEAIEQELVANAALASTEGQAEDFWKLRESISAAERADGPALQHDVSVPVADMADFIDQASAAIEGAWPGTVAIAYGHLGDGNVHFHIKAPADVDGPAWYAGDGKAISAEVYDIVTRFGGSISAEHGIGQMKLDALARLSSPARLAMLRAIKQAIDPCNIFNPGKLVPLAPAPAHP